MKVSCLDSCWIIKTLQALLSASCRIILSWTTYLTPGLQSGNFCIFHLWYANWRAVLQASHNGHIFKASRLHGLFLKKDFTSLSMCPIIKIIQSPSIFLSPLCLVNSATPHFTVNQFVTPANKQTQLQVIINKKCLLQIPYWETRTCSMSSMCNRLLFMNLIVLLMKRNSILL